MYLHGEVISMSASEMAWLGFFPYHLNLLPGITLLVELHYHGAFVRILYELSYRDRQPLLQMFFYGGMR